MSSWTGHLQYLKGFATPRDLGVMPLGFLEGFDKLFWGNQNPGPHVGFLCPHHGCSSSQLHIWKWG